MSLSPRQRYALTNFSLLRSKKTRTAIVLSCLRESCSGQSDCARPLVGSHWAHGRNRAPKGIPTPCRVRRSRARQGRTSEGFLIFRAIEGRGGGTGRSEVGAGESSGAIYCGTPKFDSRNEASRRGRRVAEMVGTLTDVEARMRTEAVSQYMSACQEPLIGLWKHGEAYGGG
ncbi:uncharacterized protein A4U43_UnF7030 [Asparagus officinalis]|uniref:Uncharacterized protein n=1 Tax=Asparagus officinalis TaxID=4686 RepID=A0A1R3L6A8_ASPOF|nr:uncharacterized protein A4U43_UnF7030 [Asparagus officinalis]